MVKISGSSALIEALKKEGVEVIFGLPGGAIIDVYDTLYDSGIKHILARHEQSAVHMADGFARASGRAGVCFATSGPGATNLVTGLATAYMDSSPIVAVTGQVPRPMIGKDAFQEVDIIGVSIPVTKHNLQVRDPRDIPTFVKELFYIATTGRPGPVLIDIPKDVQAEMCEVKYPKSTHLVGYNPLMPLSGIQVKKAIDFISGSKRPVILAGGGVKAANAFKQLLTLSEFLMAPVTTSFMGKGVFPENHPLSLGVLGMHGSPEANKVIQKSDVLIAIGFRFSDRTTGNIEEFCPDTKIIHIDIDESEVGKNKIVDVEVIGNASEAMDMILAGLRKRMKKGNEKWRDKVLQLKEQLRSDNNAGEELKPSKILKELRGLLPAETIVTTEVGQNQMWSAIHFKVFKPRTFFSSGGLGTMGFGFPAAIGAKAAKPTVPVVDIAGDGSFAMTENSLATSVVHNLPVVVVILNNRALGMVAQWQRLFYNKRYSATLLEQPDFIKLSQAYGAQGLQAKSIQEFKNCVKEALNNDVTTVIDVPISQEEDVLPMIPPGGSLKDMVGFA